MKYLYLILLFISFSACSPKERDKEKSIEPDTDFRVSKKRTDKIPIILNRPPTDSDIEIFMRNRTPDGFKDLCFHFLKADVQFEELLFALIAVDKFHISHGYYEVACCLTNCLSYLSISEHSEEIATHFLKVGSRYNDLCSEIYKSLDKRKNYENEHKYYEKMWLPKDNDKAPIVLLKRKTMLGSTEDYIELKNVLHNNNKLYQLLYYSFIMADRYHYAPAGKDVIQIIDRIYKQYELGDMGEEAKYFCGFF